MLDGIRYNLNSYLDLCLLHLFLCVRVRSLGIGHILMPGLLELAHIGAWSLGRVDTCQYLVAFRNKMNLVLFYQNDFVPCNVKICVRKIVDATDIITLQILCCCRHYDIADITIFAYCRYMHYGIADITIMIQIIILFAFIMPSIDVMPLLGCAISLK